MTGTGHMHWLGGPPANVALAKRVNNPNSMDWVLSNRHQADDQAAAARRSELCELQPFASIKDQELHRPAVALCGKRAPTASWRASMSAEPPFVYRLRVRFAECDPQKVAFNGVYGLYIDLAVFEFMRAMGFGESLVKGPLDYQVVKQSVEWTGPAVRPGRRNLGLGQPTGHHVLHDRHPIPPGRRPQGDGDGRDGLRPGRRRDAHQNAVAGRLPHRSRAGRARSLRRPRRLHAAAAADVGPLIVLATPTTITCPTVRAA